MIRQRSPWLLLLCLGPLFGLSSCHRATEPVAPRVTKQPTGRTAWSAIEGLETLSDEGRSRRARSVAAGQSTTFELWCSAAMIEAVFVQVAGLESGVEGRLELWIGDQRSSVVVDESWRSLEIVLDEPISHGQLEVRNQAATGAIALTAPSFRCAGSRPNILLISVDTLRADRLGYQGYARQTSPFIDRLAAQGVSFSEVYSTAPWTTPSHISMLTSLLPSAHGVNGDITERDGSYRVLSPEIPLLSEILARHGYRSRAMTGGRTVSERFGFGRGFEVYDETLVELDDSVIASIVDELDDFDSPWFFFLHSFDVHAPYTDSRFAKLDSEQEAVINRLRRSGLIGTEWVSELKAAGVWDRQLFSDLYDGGIAKVDEWLEQLFAQATAHGLLANTIVILTSDHGEEFGEHDPSSIWNGHCTSVFREQVHVPLIFGLPESWQQSSIQVDSRVSSIDLLPTILELVGIEAPNHLQGESLEPAFGGATLDRDVVSESMCLGPEEKALRSGDRTLIITHGLPISRSRSGIQARIYTRELYRFPEDHLELDDLATAEPEMTDELLERFYRRFDAMPEYATQKLERDEKLDEGLRALGYLN